MSGLLHEPLRIFSDLHLGHRVSRIGDIAALRPLIAGAATVVFNGDTWQELAAPYREASAAMLAQLQALCAEEGAATVFLAGNHDPGWPGPGWLELAGGRIVVTHGDALCFEGSPWKREILQRHERVMELWRQNPAAHHDTGQRLSLAREIARNLCSVELPRGRHFLQRAWDAVLPPQRALKMIEAWCTQATLGARFCDLYFPRAEVLVIGHFHRHGCWVKNRRLIINTGSFTSPGRSHWVEWNNGWLTRGTIDESPSLCRLSPTTDVWRFDKTPGASQIQTS